MYIYVKICACIYKYIYTHYMYHSLGFYKFNTQNIQISKLQKENLK